MKKVIDLNEILKENLKFDCIDGSAFENCKDAMLEFGKQLLELASENACIDVDSKNEGDTYITIIAGESCETYFEVNKQSILDTINQVKS